MYFLYPETCGVRLEDMDALFGDATASVGTPATQGTPAMRAEGDSLVHPGSPVPSLDIRGRPHPFGASSAIPGLNIDPPIIGSIDSKTQKEEQSSSVGGWLSRVMKRDKSPGSGSGSGYAPLGQGED